MNIGLTYNLRPKGFSRNDPRLEIHIEGDEWKTIHAIGEAISANHHTVEYFEVDETIYERLKSAKSRLDLVFNLAEKVSGGSDREAQLPMICEILGIAHTGPTPLSAALILNKARAKEVWRANGVSTAPWQLITQIETPLSPTLNFPVIVKPNSEGSGIGIKSSSIAKSPIELRRAVKQLLDNYHQEALVETYLPGREFTVALIGNGQNIQTLPIVEINFDSFPPDSPRVDTYEAKFVYGATGAAIETEFCPALLTKDLEQELINQSMSAYQSIGCRDFGRVDLRLDHNNKVYVMEINHPPGLMSDPSESSFFTISARVAGWTFESTIGQILDAAISRLGLK